MLLTDLNPRWIHPNIFAFDCPCCGKVTLTCKNIFMKVTDQIELFEKVFGEGNISNVVPCDKNNSWNIQGTFDNMTVTPSLNAEASGHWHGFITEGKII